MALLTMAILTMALLTMALLTMAPLTMALLTMAPLTMAPLTMALHRVAWQARKYSRGCTPSHIRLQALSHTVAGPLTYGCRPSHVRLQALSHRAAGLPRQEGVLAEEGGRLLKAWSATAYA